MHLHYSPFQFATEEQVSEYDVSAKKVVATLKKLTSKDAKNSLNIGCTMSTADAAMIPGTPNAFISPNPVGTMKDLKKPMAPTGVSKGMAPKAAPAIDYTHRNKGREHYGDRAVVATRGDMIV